MHLPIPSPTRRAGAALLVAVAACSSDGTSPPPAAQSVQVTVATAGFHLDPDGYRVLLGSREGVVGVNGSVTFDQLEPGSYSVELTGLQENCTADGGPSVGLVLAEGETKSVTFDITCAYDMSGAVLPVVACPGLVPAADH
ncbi:MAG TPA: hypothetical protein VLA43_06470, partial [Longimicrobiales bacterium]|nr:hypothetical protein [Longimicrobiales bacterium]